MELDFTSTKIATTQWLEHLSKTEQTKELIKFCEESVGDFDKCLTNFFGITAPCHIEPHHIAIYYFIFIEVLAIGSMPLRKVPKDLISNENRLECDDAEYINLHFLILKRFLAYCWAQELTRADFLRWSWAEDDLRKVADAAPDTY